MALLSQTEFESFETTSNGVKAYIQKQLINTEEINAILSDLSNLMEFTSEIKDIEDTNWNAEWEKDYEPVFTYADDIKLDLHRYDYRNQ